MRKEKTCSCAFAVLSLLMVASNIFYALSAPFLPPVYEEKHVPESYVGIVFASFSIASMIFSPYVTKMIDDFGQTKLATFALALMGLSVFLFGMIDYVTDPATIIGLSIFFRFIQGKYPYCECQS